MEIPFNHLSSAFPGYLTARCFFFFLGGAGFPAVHPSKISQAGERGAGKIPGRGGQSAAGPDEPPTMPLARVLGCLVSRLFTILQTCLIL